MDDGIIKFSNLNKFPELVHGISTRSFGDLKYGHLPEEKVAKNRQHFFEKLGIEGSEVVAPEQVHSGTVRIISKIDAGRGALKASTRIPETDGLISNIPNTYLLIITADCVSILIYDPVLRICGAVHAGWRGIISQIVPKTIDQFIKMGSEPSNLVVGLGPGICQKHFVVKKDVLGQFQSLYSPSTLIRNKDGYVDLKKAILIDLKKAEIPSQNIENAYYCPSCDNGILGSYRKEKKAAPGSAIVIGFKE